MQESCKKDGFCSAWRLKFPKSGQNPRFLSCCRSARAPRRTLRRVSKSSRIWGKTFCKNSKKLPEIPIIFAHKRSQQMTSRRVSKSSLIWAGLSAKTCPKVSDKFPKSCRKVSEAFPNQPNKHLNSLWKCFPKSNKTPKNQ